MVVKMMKWRPWPPLVSRKYEVRLVVKKLEGLDGVADKGVDKLTVEIKWKGPKMALSPLRRTAVKRNYTKEAYGVDQNGVVQWDEEFHNVCTFSAYKENVFHPWEIVFSAFNVSLILDLFVVFCFRLNLRLLFVVFEIGFAWIHVPLFLICFILHVFESGS